MSAECTPRQLEFQGIGRRSVVARMDGGSISSDGGGLVLREVDRRATSTLVRIDPPLLVRSDPPPMI
jgi:hypothetical protein